MHTFAALFTVQYTEKFSWQNDFDTVNLNNNPSPHPLPHWQRCIRTHPLASEIAYRIIGISRLR